MNIREAILKAAAFIKQNPAAYEFSNNQIPKCGTPGCMMGWIFNFLGRDGSVFKVAPELLGVSGDEFIDRALSIQRTIGFNDGSYCVGSPEQKARNADAVLRLYADKYHPATKAVAIRYPDWNGIAAQRTVLPDAVSEELR